MAAATHALVLGGSGFVGSALVRQLAVDPGVRLSVLAHRRPLPGLPAGTRVLAGGLGGFDLGWMRTDPPRWIFHSARLAGRGRWGRWWASTRGNWANRRLLQALARSRPAPRLVYVSGSLMYGSRGEQWVDEETPLRPTSFARQYERAERPVLSALAGGGEVVLARPGWVLGAGSWLQWFYLDPARQAGRVPLYGEGRNWMSLIHREDVAAGLRWLAAHGRAGQVCNLCAGAPVRQGEFVEALAAALGLPVETRPLGSLGGRADPAVAEAFSASIRMRSRHEAILGAMEWRYPDPFKALAAALAEYTGRIPPSPRPGSG